MGAVHVNDYSGTGNNGGGAITSVGCSTTSTAGNCLVAFITVGPNAAAPTFGTLSGWTNIAGATTGRIACYVKANCAANENPNFTWTNGSTAATMAICEISEYSGCGVTPSVAGFTNSGTAGSTSLSVTGTNVGDVVMSCVTMTSATSTAPTFGGTGFTGGTTGVNTSTTDGVPSKSIRSASQWLIPGSGGTQTYSGTDTGGTGTWYIAGIDLIPQASPTPTPAIMVASPREIIPNDPQPITTSNRFGIPAPVSPIVRFGLHPVVREIEAAQDPGAVFRQTVGGQEVDPLPPRIVVRELDPLPAAGYDLVEMNQTPSVAPAKTPPRAQVRSAEEPPPAAGAVILGRSGGLPPVTVLAAIARSYVVTAEAAPLLWPGAVIVASGHTTAPSPQQLPGPPVLARQLEGLPADGSAMSRSAFTAVRLPTPPAVRAQSPDMPEAGSVLIHVGLTLQPALMQRPGQAAVVRQNEPLIDTDQTRIRSGGLTGPVRDVRNRPAVVSEDPCLIRVDPWPLSSHGPSLPDPAKPPVVARIQEELPAAGQVLAGHGLTSIPAFQVSPGRPVIAATAEVLAAGQVVTANARPAATPPAPAAPRALVISTWNVLDPGGVIEGESGGPYVPAPGRTVVAGQLQIPPEPGQVLASHNPFQAMQASPRSLTVAAQETLTSDLRPLTSGVQAPAPVPPPRAVVAREAADLQPALLVPVYVHGRPPAAGGVFGPLYLSAAGVFVLGVTESDVFPLGVTASQVLVIGTTEDDPR